MLGQACTLIGEAGGDIANMKGGLRQADVFDVDIDLDVTGAEHLTHIAAALRACLLVQTVDRVRC